MDSRFDPWAFVAGNLLLALVLWFLIFGFFGFIAMTVAPPSHRLRWFLLTLFFLGPLGIGFAAIAPVETPAVKGTWQFRCERCGTLQNVPHDTKTADCWRCDENLF
jgi:hypothetical protein